MQTLFIIGGVILVLIFVGIVAAAKIAKHDYWQDNGDED